MSVHVCSRETCGKAACKDRRIRVVVTFHREKVQDTWIVCPCKRHRRMGTLPGDAG